ncbi:MAG: class I SAM-dependent methyltransferase [Deltaproteobacteria bacterium]|nr:class I SAM-dependent methyltransferase [Deltaproteobacteria bacterium]
MSSVADAYDTPAAEYDSLFVSANRRLWSGVCERWVVPGQRVLDAGCGTGIDTLALARRGVRAWGMDISSGMLDVARAAALREGVDAEFSQGDLADFCHPAAPFDAIISGFAAINTVSSPGRFAGAAARQLVPGGLLLVHFLTPGGVYDRLSDLARARWRQALSHWRQRSRVVRVGRTPVDHHTWRPDVLYREAFASHFALVAQHQVGAFVPDDGPSRVPGLLAARVLAPLDAALANAPAVVNWGRFGILVLRRR